MANTTENATRALTMRDFFKEENGEIVPIDESVLIDFKDGDIVEGDVVRIDKDEVLVDIGYKSEGLIPANELSIRKGADPQEIVELGQHIEALVLQKEDADGRLILSAKRAAFEKAWNRIEEAHQEQRTVEGPVIELNRSRNNVVLSRRAVLEEERKEERHRILTTLQEGDIVTGTISNLVDFGAFVDLEGIDGLIHISELSWNHVDHPSEVVEVAEGVEGLIHISELADHHVETPDEIVRSGDEVEARIIDVDAKRRRLSLSLRPKREERE